ncbi:ATP-binding protein [Ruegeria atlantica]|uniref:Histidine kinase-, DNA gyrase B-, and HSP90-like ATPase n=1 Tax=Ruegeria atlantica TaxID=81569 RepID=A0A0P1EBR7_9RHOB|nr:ATP-binding protein [Ruegeria atlantica]CUH46472.1 Histidine kinase-, DNA gyrase B-, and HSP90-like ATPase [Ruegeria atlantica]
MTQEFDLTPDARVLQMLGEINLHQWRCVAELIDNSIDGFVEAARAGTPVEHPEITITIPTSNKGDARLSIRDNGPGMAIDLLERAVRAGWSGNNPLTNLGLFGMGFNIATARLGTVTEVWTTRAGEPEWVGVRIDLEGLRASQSYKTPRQTRVKPDHTQHGTEIIITKLKPDQRAYLARSANLGTIRKHLARAYSAILRESEAGRIRLKVNGTKLEPRRHCHWDPDRSVELSDGTVVHAVERFDVALAPRRYCTHCMRALSGDEEQCPNSGPNCEIVTTERRVRGWVGLQRYLHKSDFGIDFIRNGRKIEIGSKDLFAWNNGDNAEIEYPIDDPRSRGRFVGEVHLDHCRVSYTKDRFERDDPSWEEMVRVVRGEGPLRPQAAKQSGFDGNTSPLYKLFQAFRRSSPQGKNGLWSRVLVVKDNDRSEQMAESFYENDADYLDDERWWKLVEEQDKEILGEGGDTDLPDGFLDNGEDGSTGGGGSQDDTDGAGVAPDPEPAEPSAERIEIHELSRKYVHPTYRVEFQVEAFASDPTDKALTGSLPWSFELDDVASRTYAFVIDPTHDVFRSTTMTALDALLTELSVQTLDFLKGQVHDVTLANILADYRSSYATATRLEPSEVISMANTGLEEFAKAVASLVPEGQGQALYAELSKPEREHVARRMAARGVVDVPKVISDGRFWEYMDPQAVVATFSRHPELFFDGKYWLDPYETLDFGADHIDEEARRRLVTRYEAYLGDTLWLANQSSRDLETANRDEIIRATCSLRLMKPDVDFE